MTFTRFGFLSWAGAALVILFQSISGLMQFNFSWSVITVGSVTNQVLDPYLEKIPYASIADFFDFVVNSMELSLLLVVVGFICVIIGAFKKV
ncbi:MAG: hypothetical protein KAI40_00450 [Desulfobacterales bacterium]|nr:hypothetical protein [Desulfobacterales bacterium]